MQPMPASTTTAAAILLLTASAAPAATGSADDSDIRRSRGLAALERVTGADGRQVVESLNDIAPDLGHWIVDFAYGDVFSRPGLDDCSRELATVAGLTALGHAQPQLAVHIAGALKVGCNPQSIVEVILQMSVYAGFPAALNALATARTVFSRQGVDVRPAAATEPTGPQP